MVICCTAASEPDPRNWISPMWLTSNSPTPVRTAMCSAINPPPGPGYSTGMSHPPKSTIFAFSARCVAFSAVFLSGAAVPTEASWDATGFDIQIPFGDSLYILTIGTRLRPGQSAFGTN